MTPLEPGPELDALVAEKVLGGPKEHPDWYWWKSTMPEWPEGQPPVYAGPKFSRSIADAWEVLQAAGRGLTMESADLQNSSYSVGMWSNEKIGWVWAEANTAPHAICLAALKAVGAIG
jgi:hypothetical protein